MDNQEIIRKITSLEKEVEGLKYANKKQFNSDTVYNTKDTFGYSQITETKGGTVVYFSGMTPWDNEMKLPSDTLEEQAEQTFANLSTLLQSKGLKFSDLISIRFYIAKPNYYDEMNVIVKIAHKYFDGPMPCAATMVGVTGLAEPNQLIEIEAIGAY